TSTSVRDVALEAELAGFVAGTTVFQEAAPLEAIEFSLAPSGLKASGTSTIQLTARVRPLSGKLSDGTTVEFSLSAMEPENGYVAFQPKNSRLNSDAQATTTVVLEH